jgi:hypothetical protein
MVLFLPAYEAFYLIKFYTDIKLAIIIFIVFLKQYKNISTYDTKTFGCVSFTLISICSFSQKKSKKNSPSKPDKYILLTENGSSLYSILLPANATVYEQRSGTGAAELPDEDFRRSITHHSCKPAQVTL